jgi:hypothetical protein
MLSVNRQSLRDAHAQLHTGHEDIRTYFSQPVVVTMAHTAVTSTV